MANENRTRFFVADDVDLPSGACVRGWHLTDDLETEADAREALAEIKSLRPDAYIMKAADRE